MKLFAQESLADDISDLNILKIMRRGISGVTDILIAQEDQVGTLVERYGLDPNLKSGRDKAITFEMFVDGQKARERFLEAGLPVPGYIENLVFNEPYHVYMISDDPQIRSALSVIALSLRIPFSEAIKNWNINPKRKERLEQGIAEPTPFPQYKDIADYNYVKVNEVLENLPRQDVIRNIFTKAWRKKAKRYGQQLLVDQISYAQEYSSYNTRTRDITQELESLFKTYKEILSQRFNKTTI